MKARYFSVKARELTVQLRRGKSLRRPEIFNVKYSSLLMGHCTILTSECI